MLMKMTMRNEVSHTIITVVIIVIIIIHKTLPMPRPPKPRPALLGQGISQNPPGLLQPLDSKPNHFFNFAFIIKMQAACSGSATMEGKGRSRGNDEKRMTFIHSAEHRLACTAGTRPQTLTHPPVTAETGPRLPGEASGR